MATGGNGDTETDDTVNKLTCAVCLENYRRPKLLPCFHTFCQSCLQGVAGSSPTFSCPSCRTPVLLPPGGVAALQTNFYIEDDLDASASSPPRRLCDVCTEDREATHTCLQCQQKFCLPCRKYHDAFTLSRGHTVVSLTPEEKDGCGKGLAPSNRLQDKQKMEMCSKHPEQRLLLHCNKCQADICMQCKLTQHDGHPTDDLADTRAIVKTKLQDVLERVTHQRHQINHLIAAFNDRRAGLVQQQQETEQDIQSRADTLHQWVNQSLDDAVTMVQSTTKELDKSLQDQVEELQNKDLALKAQQDHMIRVLKDGREADIVSLEAQLTSSCNPLENLHLKQVEKELTKNVPKFHVKHSSSAINQLQLCKFVGVLQPVHQKSPSDETATSMQINTVTASTISTDKEASSEKSSFDAGKQKSPREFLYSKNPQSSVVAICPIRNNRLWVMYSPAKDGAVLMKLFDANGRVLTTVENVQRCTGLVTIIDDSILSWVYNDYKGQSQVITSNGELISQRQGISIGNLISSATNENVYLRIFGEDPLRQIKFSWRDKLGYSVVDASFSPVPRVSTPGHVSSDGRYCAFVNDGGVTVHTRGGQQASILFSSYAANKPAIDVRFCQVDGQEQLLVLLQDETKVHVVDHLDGGRFVGYLDTGPLQLNTLRVLATNFNQHLWIGCDGGKIVMVDL